MTAGLRPEPHAGARNTQRGDTFGRTCDQTAHGHPKRPIDPALFQQPAKEWLDLLSNGRRAKLEDKYCGLRKENMFIEKLAATEFCDKSTIIIKKKLVTSILHASPQKKLKKDLVRIQELRNKVTHASAYADTREQAKDLAEVVRLCRTWVEALTPDTSSISRSPDQP